MKAVKKRCGQRSRVWFKRRSATRKDIKRSRISLVIGGRP
jgi:hypothetical protein